MFISLLGWHFKRFVKVRSIAFYLYFESLYFYKNCIPFWKTLAWSFVLHNLLRKNLKLIKVATMFQGNIAKKVWCCLHPPSRSKNIFFSEKMLSKFYIEVNFLTLVYAALNSRCFFQEDKDFFRFRRSQNWCCCRN